MKHLIIAAALSLATAAPALAHHGWTWAEEEFTELEGTVKSVSYGNPHPTLQLEADGAVWTIELATVRATRNAGVEEDTITEGATVTAIGNRSLEEGERRLKAVRLIVGDRTYDVYPNRVPD